MDHLLKSAIIDLHKNKKMVSVATIKSRVGTRVPLPFITREISNYKVDPQSYFEQYQNVVAPAISTNEQPDEISLEQRVTELEKLVASLQKQIVTLTK